MGWRRWYSLISGRGLSSSGISLLIVTVVAVVVLGRCSTARRWPETER